MDTASCVSRETTRTTLANALSAYATTKKKKKQRRARKQAVSASTYYEMEDPVTEFEVVVHDILTAEFEKEGGTVKVQHRTRVVQNDAASVMTTRTTRTMKLGNNLSGDSSLLSSQEDVHDCCPPDTVVTVTTPSFHGLSLILQHDRVWNSILSGLLAESDAGTLSFDLKLPAPVFVDHKHYSYLGYCVKQLPEFRFLSLGARLEVRTVAVSPSPIIPARNHRSLQKLQALLPDPFALVGLSGILETEFRNRAIRQNNAAVILQNKFRALFSRLFRKRGLKFHRAITTLCRWYRGCVGRRYAKLYRAARTQLALEAQRLFRGHAARRWYLDTRSLYNSATTHIQRVFRGMLGRRYAQIVAKYWGHTLRLQCAVRTYLAKCVAARLRARRLHVKVVLPGITKIQAVFRGRRTREWFQREVVEPRAAARIQCAARVWQAVRKLRTLRHRKQAATAFQRIWRGHQGRHVTKVVRLTSTQRHAAVILQSAARMWQCQELLAIRKRRDFERRLGRPAALKLSWWYRSIRFRRKLAVASRLHAAAGKLQGWYRHLLSRHRWCMDTKIVAACRIQALARGILARRQFRHMKFLDEGRRITGTCLLQRWWRGISLRRKLGLHKEAWRIRRMNRMLQDFKMMELCVLQQIRANAIDQKAQKKLRRRVEKRLDEARGERRERRERLLQIKHEQSELTEKDDWEGWTQALESEAYIKERENEMCTEEILSKSAQLQDKLELALELDLEWFALCQELDRCRCESECLMERLNAMELRLSMTKRHKDRVAAESKQRRKWLVQEAKPLTRHKTKNLENAENEVRSSLRQELGKPLPVVLPTLAQSAASLVSQVSAVPLQSLAAFARFGAGV